MTEMGTTPAQLTEPAVETNDRHDPAVRCDPAQQALEFDRVNQAAAELGVSVPRSFHLVGIGQDGQHIATCRGGPDDHRAAAAILFRLDGAPIEDCFAAPHGSPDLKPAWAPPDDWNDTEAVLAYLEERKKHPEWPTFYNSSEILVHTLEWVGGGIGAGVIGNSAYDALKALVRRMHAAEKFDLSREDATLVGEIALVVRYTQAGLEPLNLEALTCQAWQTKDGDWSLLFSGNQMAALVEIPASNSPQSRTTVSLIHHHGIASQ